MMVAAEEGHLHRAGIHAPPGISARKTSCSCPSPARTRPRRYSSPGAGTTKAPPCGTSSKSFRKPEAAVGGEPHRRRTGAQPSGRDACPTGTRPRPCPPIAGKGRFFGAMVAGCAAFVVSFSGGKHMLLQEKRGHMAAPRALTKPTNAKIALIYKKSEAIFASGGGICRALWGSSNPVARLQAQRLASRLWRPFLTDQRSAKTPRRQILPPAKFPRQLHLHPAVTYVYVSSLGCKHSFLVLRAFSTLCQSAHFVNILSAAIWPRPPRRKIILFATRLYRPRRRCPARS